MRHLKYRIGSLVLLRQLDLNEHVTTIWGGQVIASTPRELIVLAIEMVYKGEGWHAVGEFRNIAAPPHKVPFKWGFPRLLVKYEASDIDLRSRPVIEAALERYRQREAK